SQSEWAAFCERCGADLAGARLFPAPRQVRWRPRRSLLVPLAVVMVVVVAVFGLGSSRRSHTPPGASGPSVTPTSSPGALSIQGIPIMVVSVDRFGDLVGYDLLSGTQRMLATNAAGWPEGPATTANQAFFISGGNAFTPGRRSVLAAADSLVPVDGLQEMWATPSAGEEAGIASLFHVGDAWALVTRVRVDPGDTPVAAGPSRLAAVHGTDIVIRDANTGRVTGRTGPVRHPYDVVGASGDTIVFARTGGCRSGCPLSMVDMTDPQATTTILPPMGTTSFIGGGSISSTGQLAAFVSVGGSSSGKAELVIDDEAGLSVIPTPFNVEDPVGAAAWDPSDRWVVFGGPRATYLLDTATMRTTLLPFNAGYSFTVLAG
ncbi:MAG: hypothetical protein ACHQNA_04095, partial [Acidimicrobiales bacterium]